MSQRVSRRDAQHRILAATARLLATCRFRELTVEAVMAEAGLARTVFYRHFDGLPGLVLAALDEAVEAAPQAPPRTVYEMLERNVALFAAHGRLLAAVEEAAHHDAEVERTYRDAFDRSVEAVAPLVARHVAEPHAVARALMHLSASYLTDALARAPEPDADEALRTLWTVWSRVLGITAAPARSDGA